MLHRNLYYHLKPFLPWRLRMAVRRRFALRALPGMRDTWPIYAAAGHKPEGWHGWPDGKQFAFVLTHDVEGPAGLERVQQLAELEMKHGFRSSFNFIPEGPYTVPPYLRTWLTERGFEVGVHDLHHDGRLYRDRATFAKHAQRINRYLREWNAVGFRAGFMLNELEWHHDLDIVYDASTFDTDPFEPQPEGQETIFPFFVERTRNEERKDQMSDVRHQTSVLGEQESSLISDVRPLTSLAQRSLTSQRASRRGYVELPYTLPQDSTLFLVLREKTPEIWLRKLDWVAAHGGMAMLIVHPDYVRFDGDSASASTFPAAHYEALLQQVAGKYRGKCWAALPREVAQFVQPTSMPGSDQRNEGAGRTARVKSRPRPKIWIDLDNTPHVPFFEPIIEALRSRDYPVFVTARDAFQVCDLADRKGLGYVKVGRHHGKNTLRKGGGLALRAGQLLPHIMREKPALGVSHGARSQLLLGNLLRIPTLLIEDYEFSQFPALMRPTWVMAPEAIPANALARRNGHSRKYPGIKEDVYAWKLAPDPQVLTSLGVGAGDLTVTVRPPATEAHYHNPESDRLFERFMHRAAGTSGVRVVLLPRNHKQEAHIRQHWPEWFADNKTVVPFAALDGLNLMWHSDLVVSGGGTMNREAAAIGVPVYSIFRGTIGAVDRHLSTQGRLTLIESLEEVDSKILLQKRERRTQTHIAPSQTLDVVVNTIIEIADRYRKSD